MDVEHSDLKSTNHQRLVTEFVDKSAVFSDSSLVGLADGTLTPSIITSVMSAVTMDVTSMNGVM